MRIADHNNGQSGPNSTAVPAIIRTLGDLRIFILGSDLSESEKAQICSAIKRVDELIGHGNLDLPADARKIMAKLAPISPAMAGMSSGAWANTKSRVRKAFRLAANLLASPRNRPPLSTGWLSMLSQCDERERRDISRFSHFANGQGWSPEDITDAHLERFKDHLGEVILPVDMESVTHQTISAWNKIAKRKGTLVLPLLTPPEPKRTPYWIEQSQFPESLRTRSRYSWPRWQIRPCFPRGRRRRARNEKVVSGPSDESSNRAPSSNTASPSLRWSCFGCGGH